MLTASLLSSLLRPEQDNALTEQQARPLIYDNGEEVGQREEGGNFQPE